jgi:hypothetical protein
MEGSCRDVTLVTLLVFVSGDYENHEKHFEDTGALAEIQTEELLLGPAWSTLAVQIMDYKCNHYY